jgi:succinate dehydrogenase / fumarate reductase cytochrome b subunit
VAVSSSVESGPSGSFFSRNEFLIRRLHSLSGLLPVGAYMCVHLITNASTLGGPAMFQKNVDLIHSLGPALPIVEWSFIFLPLLFHAIVGVVIIRSGQPNLSSYHYMGNVRYTLQRVTAWIALFFILYHVFHMHGWFHNETYLKSFAEPMGGHQFDPHRATSTAAIALASPLKKVAYAVGVIACVYHLANGLWTMGITWGVWTTAAAQKRANWIALAFGLALTAVGLAALTGVSKTDVPKAEAYEQAHIEAQHAEEHRAEELLKEKQATASTPKTDAAKK